MVHRLELAQPRQNRVRIGLECGVESGELDPRRYSFAFGARLFNRHGSAPWLGRMGSRQGLSYQTQMTARTGRCYDAHVPLLNVFDYEQLALRKLSQTFFDYIAGGADDEVTLRRNREAFERIELRPRALVDVSKVDLSTSILGQDIELPVILAPVAVQRLAHPEGELATARAAAAAGTVMALSTMASASIEEVAAASEGPKWFQL